MNVSMMVRYRTLNSGSSAPTRSNLAKPSMLYLILYSLRHVVIRSLRISSTPISGSVVWSGNVPRRDFTYNYLYIFIRTIIGQNSVEANYIYTFTWASTHALPRVWSYPAAATSLHTTCHGLFVGSTRTTCLSETWPHGLVFSLLFTNDF